MVWKWKLLAALWQTKVHLKDWMWWILHSSWHIENIFHVIAPLKFQITIDVSPPHEGSVHDGIRGEPEVDYQQDLHTDAYWEGFFDRESGVEYYQYVFSDHCLTNSEFTNSTQVFIFVVSFLKFYISRILISQIISRINHFLDN